MVQVQIYALNANLPTGRVLVNKQYHEVRDPIHVFVRLDSDERRILDSPPVQRLRDVHQMAMSYLVYPGATHKRFEHALGTMELAERVFDVVTADANLHPSIRTTVPEISRSDERKYWRKVLRMAALCHDIGHLPFSHAAEKELLPEGWNHERISKELILSDELKSIWRSMIPPLEPMHVARIAVGKKEFAEDNDFSTWQALLSEVITSDVLGVDRMDYLLRDSHHTGVAYGRFDHYRLIDTMRLLPVSQESDEPALGVEIGGLHSAEALLLARYYMFMQVYHHQVRMAYDFHLQQFFQNWLPKGHFPIDIREHQKLTDNDVLVEISKAASDPSAPGHTPASRIVNRKHFKPVYIQTRQDKKDHGDPVTAVFSACVKKYGEHKARKAEYHQSSPVPEFPVVDSARNIVSAYDLSDVVQQIPRVDVGIVFMEPDLAAGAQQWITRDKQSILSGAQKVV